VGYPVLFGSIALLLGVIGFGRAVAEFGASGAVAFGKLVLAPVGIVIAWLLFAPVGYAGRFPRSYFPSNHALKVLFAAVVVLTGAALAASALFGVAWLVTK
jgi:hypothetical protein